MPNQGKVAGFYSPSHSGTYAKALGRQGFWLAPEPVVQGLNTAVNLRVYWQPLWIGAVSRTVNTLGLRIRTAGETDSVVRLGLYANGSDGRPGALLVDGGTVAADTTGVKTLAVSQAVSAEWVWTAALTEGASSTPPEWTIQNGQPVGMGASTDNRMLTSAAHRAWILDNASSGLPDPASFDNSGADAPVVAVEVS